MGDRDGIHIYKNDFARLWWRTIGRLVPAQVSAEHEPPVITGYSSVVRQHTAVARGLMPSFVVLRSFDQT